ncbi:MAG TPA: hypothetical protein VHB99_16695 [Pirellulales bacterium]|nr:hypothetical protein [Pirellulales bacterium]
MAESNGGVRARKLQPGETVIGFMTQDGKLIGEFGEPSLGHDAMSYLYPGLRGMLKSGQAIAITLGKTLNGAIRAFGSGAFPPPGGVLSAQLRQLAAKLVI